MKKNQMIKKIFICALVFIMFNFKNSDAEMSSSLEQLIDKVETISLEGKKELLYKQFKNQKDSLLFIGSKYLSLFEYVKEYYGLSDLSEENWLDYYKIFRSENFPHKYNDDLIVVNKFFDIFENKYKNDEIKDRLRFISEIKKNEKYDEYLSYILPSSSSYSNKYNNSNMKISKEDEKKLENKSMKDKILLKRASTNLPNQQSAINYAERYATNPNTGVDNYYYFVNGDCANFVSQIFEAGGRKQIVYNGSYTVESGGWWHYYDYPHGTFGLDGGHKHSYAWSMANTFVHYFGTSMTTKSHKAFSTQIVRGSVIAFDDYDDGDWDHVAYVTDADNYSSNYNGKDYYDYKVAQHTKNYLAWTSSGTNNWEYLEDSGARYAIVRD